MALRPLWQRMTLADRLLVGGLVLFAAAFIFMNSFRAPGLTMIVEQDNRITHSYPLTTDQTLNLSGPLGTSVVEIKDGAVHFVSSPCPNKVCIGMGRASKAGDILACVPNHLLLRISGKSALESDHDLITR